MSTEKKAPAAVNNLQKLQPLAHKLQRAVDNKKYLQPHTTLNSMAHDLASNRTYLSDLIHLQFGMTFTDYINYLRIEEAKRILAEDSENVLIRELYVNLGYNSPTSFYRNFKRLVGMSTTEYVRSLGKKTWFDAIP